MQFHCKNKSYIGNAIRKYGWKNFTKRILESGLTVNEVKKREQFFIQKYNSRAPNGYNLNAGGDGQINPSAETRAKTKATNDAKSNKEKAVILAKIKATKDAKSDDEKAAIRKKQRESHLGGKGSPGKRSKKATKNIRKAAQKRDHTALSRKSWVTRRKNGTDKPSAEARAKMSKAGKGRKWSVKSRKKQSKSMMGNQNGVGYTHSKEWCENTSKRMTDNSPMIKITAKNLGETVVQYLENCIKVKRDDDHRCKYPVIKVRAEQWNYNSIDEYMADSDLIYQIYGTRKAFGRIKLAAKRRGLTVAAYIKQRDENKRRSMKYNIEIRKPKLEKVLV